MKKTKLILIFIGIMGFAIQDADSQVCGILSHSYYFIFKDTQSCLTTQY